jgi:hypothetical protein
VELERLFIMDSLDLVDKDRKLNLFIRYFLCCIVIWTGRQLFSR